MADGRSYCAITGTGHDVRAVVHIEAFADRPDKFALIYI